MGRWEAETGNPKVFRLASFVCSHGQETVSNKEEGEDQPLRLFFCPPHIHHGLHVPVFTHMNMLHTHVHAIHILACIHTHTYTQFFIKDCYLDGTEGFGLSLTGSFFPTEAPSFALVRGYWVHQKSSHFLLIFPFQRDGEKTVAET